MPRRFRPPRRKASVAEQAAWITRRWGSNWTVKRKGSTITATGSVRPSDLCREYRVQVIYVDGQQPKISVLDPPLERLPDGTKIPHMYQGEHLCVFHPGYGDWTKTKLLANTVIPWIAEWLLFYEYWLATSEWLGGGVHPGSSTAAQPQAATTGPQP